MVIDVNLQWMIHVKHKFYFPVIIKRDFGGGGTAGSVRNRKGATCLRHTPRWLAESGEKFSDPLLRMFLLGEKVVGRVNVACPSSFRPSVAGECEFLTSVEPHSELWSRVLPLYVLWLGVKIALAIIGSPLPF